MQIFSSAFLANSNSHSENFSPTISRATPDAPCLQCRWPPLRAAARSAPEDASDSTTCCQGCILDLSDQWDPMIASGYLGNIRSKIFSWYFNISIYFRCFWHYCVKFVILFFDPIIDEFILFPEQLIFVHALNGMDRFFGTETHTHHAMSCFSPWWWTKAPLMRFLHRFFMVYQTWVWDHSSSLVTAEMDFGTHPQRKTPHMFVHPWSWTISR